MLLSARFRLVSVALLSRAAASDRAPNPYLPSLPEIPEIEIEIEMARRGGADLEDGVDRDMVDLYIAGTLNKRRKWARARRNQGAFFGASRNRGSSRSLAPARSRARERAAVARGRVSSWSRADMERSKLLQGCC
jgi:hypothetical protein